MHDRSLIILLLLAAGYKALEYTGSAPSLLSSYFEDIIALPLMLLIAQWLIRKLHVKWRAFKVNIRDVIVITIGFALYFEGVLPVFDSRFTPDPIDIFCYASGSLIFLWINKQSASNAVNKAEA